MITVIGFAAFKAGVEAFQRGEPRRPPRGVEVELWISGYESERAEQAAQRPRGQTLGG
jgi:hypothetical protein